MRLLTGVAAGQPEPTTLTGDESLSQRPMERIAAPLRQMGARIETTNGHAPIQIAGADELRGMSYELPVASAQVKSAVLLAGLFAATQTTVVEPTPTRDHTELMLESAGVRVVRGPTARDRAARGARFASARCRCRATSRRRRRSLQRPRSCPAAT